MKFAIIGLCLLGVIAAACAALLVKGMHPPVIVVQAAPATQPQAAAQVTVLYATRELPPMTVIDGSMISSRTMSPSEAPKAYLSNTTDVVGKVVKQTLVTGQPYTATCFYEESGSRLLASVIPPGKRAVAISVSDYAGLDGLIYPGSMVDVMASFKTEALSGEHHDATTTTLLENVQVLAYEQQTVVSPENKSLLGDLGNGSRMGNMRRVTLLVDTRQSKTLELGMELGTLSLALRNPLDTSEANKDAITFHSMMGESQAVEQSAASSLFSNSTPTTQPTEQAHWDVIVMRGGTIETRTFVLPSAQEGK